MDAVRAPQRDQNDGDEAGEEIHAQPGESHHAEHQHRTHQDDGQRVEHSGPVTETQIQDQHQESHHERDEHRQVPGDEHRHVVHEEWQAAKRHRYRLGRTPFHQERFGGAGDPLRRGEDRCLALGPRGDEPQLNRRHGPVLAHQIADEARVRLDALTQRRDCCLGCRHGVSADEPPHLHPPFRGRELERVGEPGGIVDAVGVLKQLGQIVDE